MDLSRNNLSKDGFPMVIHCEANIVFLSNPKMICHSASGASFDFITGEINLMAVYNSA